MGEEFFGYIFMFIDSVNWSLNTSDYNNSKENVEHKPI